MSPFYEYKIENPQWDPYGLQDDEYIETASNVLGFNLAPHFEFWGIIPSDDLVQQLSSMPTSDVIKDRIIHFRSIVPENKEAFQSLYNVMSKKLGYPDRYESWKDTYDEVFAKRITDRIDEILNKYYEINAFDYNQNPVITGLADALYGTINMPITLSTDDLLVHDFDNVFPNDFTLNVYDGDNYSLIGNTVTPDTDFSGALSVPVTVNDGLEDSEQYLVKITIIPENIRPVISGLVNALSVDEETALNLSLNQLIVEDNDHSYPDDFTLIVHNGENYFVSGTTITPDVDFTEQLSVTVMVNDGIQDSKPFEFELAVNPINDKPMILGLGRHIQTNEDEPIHLRGDDFVVTDVDHEPGNYGIEILEGENYSVIDNTITPKENFHGRLSVTIIANDGVDDSEPYNFNLEVLPVNDKPVIAGLAAPLSTLVDVPITLSLTDVVVMDPDNEFPIDFTFTVFDGDNYSVSETVITPDPSFVGELFVAVLVNDGLEDSEQFIVTIDVRALNEAPAITGLITPLSTSVGTPITLSVSDLVVEDPDNDFPDDFSLTVFDGNNYSVSETTIMPDPSFIGELSVPVSVNDGLEESEQFIVKIDVKTLNEVPVITGTVSLLSTNEGTALTLSLSDFVVEDSDNDFPGDFTLSIYEGDNYTLSGSTVTPDDEFVGVLSVPVTVDDGADHSEEYLASIEVLQVLSVDEERINRNFSIYPNPVSDFLTVEVNPGSRPYSIKVFSLQGDTKYDATDIRSKDSSIDLSQLNSGIYVIQIVSEKEVGNMKIVKQ